MASVAAAWVGNVSEGLGHNYRRAAENGQPRPIEIRDHSNFSIALALWAAAWNVPYLPTVSLLGSDILKTNPGLRQVDGLVQVAALKPDVAVLHVQRADENGRAHAWGPLGISEDPATLTVRGGRLVDASGGHGPEYLELLRIHGELGTNLAELGIGTNDRATLTGNVLEDEKILGTVHVAFGASAGIGGTVSVAIHLDVVVADASLEVDGTQVLDAGRWVLDT